MNNIDKAIESAIANLSIDNLNLSKEQINIIKENLSNNGDIKQLIKKSMITKEENNEKN